MMQGSMGYVHTIKWKELEVLFVSKCSLLRLILYPFPIILRHEGF